MSKYTPTAHEARRTRIQGLRDIMNESPRMINSHVQVAKTIGRLSAYMPRKKADFIIINADVAFLLQDNVLALMDQGHTNQWTNICKNLRG